MARGRPRAFDTEQALETAMLTFWEHGYQTTSLDELTAAMKITRPSLYAAFGDKEQLFLQAIERYRQRFSARIGSALAEDIETKAAIGLMLQRMVEILTDSTLPRGCFLVNSTVECCGWNDSLQRRFAEYHALTEAAIYERLRQGQIKGELLDKVDIRSLAQFYNGVSQGMAVLAKAQTDPVAIRNIAETAMRAW
ncbi:MAG: TetR/AcrR family transcriptional regulator [Cyanobacteria bacterium J06597_16]